MIMPFGKHRGREVNDLPKNYLQWLIDNVEFTSQRLEDAIYKALDGYTLSEQMEMEEMCSHQDYLIQFGGWGGKHHWMSWCEDNFLEPIPF